MQNYDERVNCFQLIYFRPTDSAKLRTHIGVSDITMVQFKLALQLYRVTVMTVYGSELLDFPTALSCVYVFFARSSNAYFEKIFFSLFGIRFLPSSLKIQVRIFLQLIFLQISLYMLSVFAFVQSRMS